MRVNRYVFFIFLSKIFYLFFATLIIARLTKLGDTERYLSAVPTFSSEIFFLSTSFMDFFGGWAATILGSVLGNLPAALLSAYGIIALYKELKLNKKLEFLFIAFCWTPSFGIWTSIHSKESFSNAAICILLAQFIKFYRGVVMEKLFFWGSLYLIALMKPQYLPAFALLFSYVSLVKNASSSNKRKVAVIWSCSIFLVVIGLVLYFAENIGLLSTHMYIHFSYEGDGLSTRPNLWRDTYDFFYYMFYGAVIAFWGPTVSEASNNLLNLMVFVESFFIVLVLMYLFMSIVMPALLRGKLRMLACYVAFLPITYLLIVHYPFGFFNPGSAIRYRESFILFIIGIILFLKGEVYEAGVCRKR